MAITAYPKPATSITTDQFRDFFRELVGTGAVTTTALKPFGDSSGLVVKIDPGFGVVDGIAVNSTVIESRAVGAGSGGGLSRIDTLVANLDFAATPIIQLAVIAGVASTTPVPPSLALSGTVVYRWAMADIAVSPAAATITAADVTDRRSFMTQGTGEWTTALRPAGRLGILGFNTTAAVWEFHNGTAWVNLLPALISTNITDSTVTGRAVLTAVDAAAGRTALAITYPNLGTVPVANGGTGAVDAGTARTNLGVTYPNIGTVPVANGGTGAIDAAAARTNLNVPISTHTHNIATLTAGNFDNTGATITSTDFTVAGTINGAGAINITGSATVGNITTGGTTNLNGQLYVPDAYNFDITGTRRAGWWQSNGRAGWASSSATKKNVLGAAEITDEQIAVLEVIHFEYLNEIAKRDDPTHPEYQKGYHVGTNLGMTAEALHDAGLWQFVIYGPDHETPEGIHYELLGLALIPTVQRLMLDRDAQTAALTALTALVAALTERVKALEV